MDDMSQFLRENQHELINDGISGAQIYSINDNLILKRAEKSKITESGIYETFQREVRFYHYATEHKLEFVPKVLKLFENDSQKEVGILMAKYRPIEKEKIESKIEKIFSTLSKLHAIPFPPENELLLTKCNIVNMKSSDIKSYSDGWKSVLNEHSSIKWNGIQSNEVIDKIASNINEINSKFYIEKLTLIHGDFHLSNCLEDEIGKIVICDWQNVCIGNPASDLSFFLSRLSADGVKINDDEAISIYLKYCDDEIDKEKKKKEILNSMNLGEMNTSFMFWHEYLHNCPEERVSRVFFKMADSWNELNKKL